jgi:HlyD family secretion protein
LIQRNARSRLPLFTAGMRTTVTATAFATVVLASAGYLSWARTNTVRLPDDIAQANGRLEIERVDIATKVAGRVAEISVKEGDYVERQSVVARMDTADLLAQLASAKASVRRAAAVIGRAQAERGSREAELKLHEVQVSRALGLSRGVLSQAEIDKRTAERDVAKASLTSAVANIADAEAAKEFAEAQVAQIQVLLDDMTLKAPVSGRVEYKLAQPGEIVAAGGRVATLLDLTDVFMTIFLPTADAGRLALGAEARIVLDAAPQYVVPATVTFVASEAQFTPKYVETQNERIKLMYRVKLKIDPKLLAVYRDYVKAGLTGTAYVPVRATAVFPSRLQPRLPEPERAARAD